MKYQYCFLLGVSRVPGKMQATFCRARVRHRFALAGLLCISLGAHGYAPRAQALPHHSTSVRCVSPTSKERADSQAPPPPPQPTAAAFSQSEVPTEQQPTYELRELRTEAFFTWPERDGFQTRLVYIWLPATLVVSMPIALSTYDVQQQLPAALLAANVGGSAVLVSASRTTFLWVHPPPHDPAAPLCPGGFPTAVACGMGIRVREASDQADLLRGERSVGAGRLRRGKGGGAGERPCPFCVRWAGLLWDRYEAVAGPFRDRFGLWGR